MAPPHKRTKLAYGITDEHSNHVSAQAGRKSVSGEDGDAALQRRSLFVRSLPGTTTTESLTALFSECYPIRHATAVIDATTQQCRGYGFVTFADAEDAQKAKEEFDGQVLEGRKLRVEVAEPRHRDPDKKAGAHDLREKTVSAPRQRQSPRLIVRNLPWTIKTADQLAKLFMSYGKIKQAYIPKKGPGLLAGFGFVVLRGQKNAQMAIEHVNGKEIDGRTIAVDWALSKDVFEGLKSKEELAKGVRTVEEPEDTTEFDSEIEGHTGDTDANEDPDVGAGMSISPENSKNNADITNPSDSADENDEASNQGHEDVDILMDDKFSTANASEDKSSTLFIRNLPFACTDEDLEEHFSQFGNLRYARVVLDRETERSKGTGFVCFYNKSDADTCAKGAPRRLIDAEDDKPRNSKTASGGNSVLQNQDLDPSGLYTLDGRVLQVSRAVNKSEVNRLTEEGATQRHKRNEDKRRLYLLAEGTISSKSRLWDSLAPSERTMREASAKQRKTLIESNPSLHLSLTRLSIRNIPRSIDSKELKTLARQAVVGFAADVKAGTRQKLSNEELAREGDEMRAAEHARKKSGKGVVKQAKVVFEGMGGSKVSEESGAGRSRGYGFIEYHTHRNALMGLRWLNGHAVNYQVKGEKVAKNQREEVQDRKKRLIVEFAIENAQVVKRRAEKEVKARERSQTVQTGTAASGVDTSAPSAGRESRKRKRGPEIPPKKGLDRSSERGPKKAKVPLSKAIDQKKKHENQMIGRKRAIRRGRKEEN